MPVYKTKVLGTLSKKSSTAIELLPPKKLREAALQPLEKLLAEFIASLVERGRCEDHGRHNRERLTTLFSKCRWRQLRDVTAEDFIKWRSSSKLSAKTRNEYLGHAAAFFNWLVRNDRFTHNPLKSVTKLAQEGHSFLGPRTSAKDLKACDVAVDDFGQGCPEVGKWRLAERARF